MVTNFCFTSLDGGKFPISSTSNELKHRNINKVHNIFKIPGLCMHLKLLKYEHTYNYAQYYIFTFKN